MKSIISLFLILTSCATSSHKEAVNSNNSQTIEFNQEVSGVCVNIVNQLMIIENTNLIGYSEEDGFLVDYENEKRPLGSICLFSSKKKMKDYLQNSKVKVYCVLDSYVLESSNYYMKQTNQDVIELYNPEYEKTYITHPKACSLIKEEKNGTK